jgi:hypothetical protein
MSKWGWIALIVVSYFVGALWGWNWVAALPGISQIPGVIPNNSGSTGYSA